MALNHKSSRRIRACIHKSASCHCQIAAAVMLCFVLIAVLFPISAFAETPAFPVSNEEQAVLMETGTLQILNSQKADTRIDPGSLVNYLTVLTAVRHADLSAGVTVPDNVESAVPEEAAVIFLRPGENLTVRDCIGALLFNSANDAAYTLAVSLAGSVDAYITWMNETAAACGAVGTHISSIYTLVDANQYSTPKDLARIASYFSREKELYDIMSSDLFTIAPTNKVDESRYYPNDLPLRQTVSLTYIEYVTGGRYSRNNILVFARSETMDLVGVISGTAGEDSAYYDIYDLMRYGLDYYQPVTIQYDGSSIARIPVYSGSNKISYADITIDGDLTFYAETLSRKPTDAEGLGSFFSHTLSLPDKLEAPVQAGEKVGTVIYTMLADPEITISLDCVVMDSVTLPRDVQIAGNTTPGNAEKILSLLHWIILPVIVIVIILLLLPRIRDFLRRQRGPF